MNGYVLLIISQLMLGSVAVFARISGLPADAVVLFRCLFGAVSIGLFVLYYDSIREYLKFNKTLGLLVLTGGFMAANWLYFFKAVLTTTITSSILLYNLAPIFVVISAAIFLKETPTVRQLAAIVVSFGGVILILGENPLTMQSADFQGCVYALVAGALYSQVTILGRRLKHIPARVLTFFQTSVGAIALAPMAMGSVMRADFTASTWLVLVTMGVFHTSVPYLMYFHALRTVKATAAGILQYIYTLASILFGVLLYQEEVSATLLAGGLLIVVSSFIALKYPGTKTLNFKLHKPAVGTAN